MNYSDYIIYVDESGDSNLDNPNISYPMFVLAFCIFKKSDYFEIISPAIQRFKFNHFGHDAIILHESDIRKQNKPFIFLKSLEKRELFMNDLSEIIAKSPMTVISAAINKINLKEKYSKPTPPYNLALKFCLERLNRFLSAKGQNDRITHLIFEKRGKDEDRDLELEFRRIKDGVNFSAEKYPNMEIIFADKRTNSAGLQFADLIARPIGLKQANPTQHNRAYDIIEKKFNIDRSGDFLGVGLKPFP